MSRWNRGCDTNRSGSLYQEANPTEQAQAGKVCTMDPAQVESAQLSGTEWAAARFERRFGSPELSDEGSFEQGSSAHQTSYAADLDSLPPDEKPIGTKVPEPATIALLGVGMVTVARVSRFNRQGKSPLSLAAARFKGTHQH